MKKELAEIFSQTKLRPRELVEKERKILKEIMISPEQLVLSRDERKVMERIMVSVD